MNKAENNSETGKNEDGKEKTLVIMMMLKMVKEKNLKATPG